MNKRIRAKLIQHGHSFIEPKVQLPDKPFFKWFWENVLGYSSEEYRREFWREACQYGHTIGPMPKTFGARMGRTVFGVEKELGEILTITLLFGAPATFFYFIRLAIRRYLKLLRRPSYYEREREHRLELGRQRRSILHRTTLNPKPTIEAIRSAWNGARHSPEGALRLGGLLEDLECFVNNSAKGNAVTGYRGRYGGIKRFLQENAPDLFEHYAALMRYKSIARRFRQACNLEDPIPATAAIPLDCQTIRAQTAQTTKNTTSKARKKLAPSGEPTAHPMSGNPQTSEKMAGPTPSEGKTKSLTSQETDKTGMGNCFIWSYQMLMVDGIGFPKQDFKVKEEALVTALRILRKCENSVISLEAALALEIDPDCVERGGRKKSGPIKSNISSRVSTWLRKRQVA